MRKSLMVEALDDKHAVESLLRRHNVTYYHPNNIETKVMDGLSYLLQGAPTAAKSYGRLGLMIDADESTPNRWKEVRLYLKNSGIALPEQPAAEGTIVPGIRADWKLGIWLMPNNNDPGKLEDFLVALIDSANRCWPYAQEVCKEAKNQYAAPFREIDRSKAQIRTWLAWQKSPGLSFGAAISEAYFRHDTKEALSFVNWYRRLFIE